MDNNKQTDNRQTNNIQTDNKQKDDRKTDNIQTDNKQKDDRKTDDIQTYQVVSPWTISSALGNINPLAFPQFLPSKITQPYSCNFSALHHICLSVWKLDCTKENRIKVK
jgi:hypothetical protein